VRPIILLIALGVCAVTAAVLYLPDGTSGVSARSESESLQRVLLDAARGRLEDPALGLLFEDLNRQHFGGQLPDVKVLWEEALHRLDAGDYRQNGMTDGTVILLNTALRDDDTEVRRTICHEMVHVKFIARGRTSTAHDEAFQTELRRIFDEGCFQALWASPEEKASLEQWITVERARLDAARADAEAQLAAIQAEEARVERLIAGLNERTRAADAAGSGWPSQDELAAAEAQRTALSDRVSAYNAAIAAHVIDRAQFNEAVQRYNLMVAYPDGLAEDRAKGLIRRDP